MGYYTGPAPYVEHLAQNLDNVMKYSDYIQEHMDKSISYVEYLADKVSNQNRMFTYDLVHDPSFNIGFDVVPIKPIPVPIQRIDKVDIGWWCQKNKTSDDFWKYKL